MTMGGERIQKLEAVWRYPKKNWRQLMDIYDEFKDEALKDPQQYLKWYIRLQDIQGRNQEDPLKAAAEPCFDMIRVFVSDVSEGEEIDEIYDCICKILDKNLQCLGAQEDEVRFFALQVCIDILVAFAREDDKIVYTAMLYDILKAVDDNEQYRNFYGRDARTFVAERTIESAFYRNGYGADSYENPRAAIEAIRQDEDAQEFVTNFCDEMLKVSDNKLREILEKPYREKTKSARSNQKLIIGGAIIAVAGMIIGLIIGSIAFGGEKNNDQTVSASEYQRLVSENTELREENDSLNKKLSDMETTIDNENIIDSESSSETTAETKEGSTVIRNSTEETEQTDGTDETHNELDFAVPEPGSNWVIPESINFRGSKSLDEDNVIIVLKKGDNVTILEKEDSEGWIKIENNGDEGYVNFKN